MDDYHCSYVGFFLNYYFVEKVDFVRKIWFASLPDFFFSDAGYGFTLKKY